MHTIEEAYTYADLLLVPQPFEDTSRSEVSTSVSLAQFTFAHPIVVANMESLISERLLLEIINKKGLALNQRIVFPQNQVAFFKKHKDIIPSIDSYYGISIGVKPEDIDLAKDFVDLGGKIICIDIAHGDSRPCYDMLAALRKLPNRRELLIIAGNVATKAAANRLYNYGADVVKAGIGAGSTCLTRVKTGHGYPSMSMLFNIWNLIESYHSSNRFVIADGGLTDSGDMVKALTRSHMVMSGNLFAGCDESRAVLDNNIYEVGSQRFADYSGSSTYKNKHVEGVKARVKLKNKSYAQILEELLDGITSGCTYHGVLDLVELKENPQFVKVTPASIAEAGAHHVKVSE